MFPSQGWLLPVAVLIVTLQGCSTASKSLPEPVTPGSGLSNPFSGHPPEPGLVVPATDPPGDGGQRPIESESPRYRVVVDRVPAQELLFTLARDAHVDVDIAGIFDETITLNAPDATLTGILDRISLQVPLRYRLEPGYLRIERDLPEFRRYAIPYLNMGRKSFSRIDLATQIGSTGMGESGGGQDGSNNSRTRIENVSDHLFWDSLTANLASLLGIAVAESDHSIVVNREAGLVSVKATTRGHDMVSEYIESIVASSRRQVLIEASIVEVQLDVGHQSGVDWSAISADGEGLSLDSGMLGANLGATPSFTLDWVDSDSAAGIFALTLKALQEYGEVRVLSSPKLIAMNNQTAVIKVVDNRVYFTTSVSITEASDGNPRRETFDTELHTVPVGLVMNLTPFISEGHDVLLNVRPTISRILAFANDPNPDLADAGVISRIPEIQVRELESLLRVKSGRLAMIGGLIQDRDETTEVSVPWLSNLPLVGRLFRYSATRSVKTELLVFIRPTVVRMAETTDSYDRFRRHLP